jgi:hypothetical protein
MAHHRLNDHPSNSKLSICVGDTLSFHYLAHASVGYFGDYALQGQACRFVDEDFVYKHPDLMAIEGMTGCDEAEGIFRFEALEPGTAQLKFEHNFRGEIEQTWHYELDVQPKKEEKN